MVCFIVCFWTFHEHECVAFQERSKYIHMLNSSELLIYIDSLFSLNQNRASFSPYRKPSLLEICQCKWWVPYNMQCTSCMQAPVWWVFTCIRRESSCRALHTVRPSEEGTPKVLGLYFRNALSLLQALPNYHTLSLQDLQYYFCLLLLLLVKMSNFLLKCIQVPFQVPFQLKIYKFEHE
jgi:hypothetical protein